jgi:hypothetical protein
MKIATVGLENPAITEIKPPTRKSRSLGALPGWEIAAFSAYSVQEKDRKALPALDQCCLGYQATLIAYSHQYKEFTMQKQTTIRMTILTATMAVLVGCAGATQENTVQLPDPKDVPKEKWSDAMNVLTAMGITGQRDVPLELVGKASGGMAGTSSGGAAADAALSGVNFAAPATGFSGSAAGVGIGLMLLGGSSDPARTYQTAAWVPSELAHSPEEASALVLKIMEEARIKSFPKARSSLALQVGMYPSNHSRAYPNPAAFLADRPTPFTATNASPPEFVKAKSAYGPIFILNNQFTVDGSKNDLTPAEAIQLMSQNLPEWFYIYHPGQQLRKNAKPAAILNQGKAMYFVSK